MVKKGVVECEALLLDQKTDMVEKCVKEGKVMLFKVAMLYEVMGIDGCEEKVKFINNLKETFNGTVLESAFKIDLLQPQNLDILLKNKACEILAEYDTKIKYISKHYLEFRNDEDYKDKHKQTIIDNFHTIRNRVPSEIIIETKKQEGYWFNDPISPIPAVIAICATASLFPAGLITAVVLGYASGTIMIPTLVGAGTVLLAIGCFIRIAILSLELKDTGHKVESKDFLGKITSNNGLSSQYLSGNNLDSQKEDSIKQELSH